MTREVALSLVACGTGDYMEARKLVQTGLKGQFAHRYTGYILLYLPLVSFLLAKEGEKLWAVEILSLAFNHPASPTGWMEKWPLLTRLRAGLQGELGDETYAAAWERGASLDLETVEQSLLSRWRVDSEPEPNQLLVDPLTPRELEILRLIVAGYSNPQIAHELILAVGTVKAYTHHIYSKLGVTSRTQAVARARELHLL